MQTQIGYAAVRVTNGREWIDMATFSGDPNMAIMNADKTDVLIPWWAQDNRRLRIAQVEVAEVTR